MGWGFHPFFNMGLQFKPSKILKGSNILDLLNPGEMGEVPMKKGPSRFLYKDHNGFGHWINFLPYNGSSEEDLMVLNNTVELLPPDD